MSIKFIIPKSRGSNSVDPSK